MTRSEKRLTRQDDPLEFSRVCSFCGGKALYSAWSDNHGRREVSSCCHMPWTLIVNYDTFAALSPHLQKIAIEKEKAKIAAMDAATAQEVAAFKQRKAEMAGRYDYLRIDKGEL